MPSNIQNTLKKYAMLIALIVIMLLFQVLTNGILLKPQNVSNLILQNSYVIILAIGMILCIITGGNIDLSVGSVVAFVGATLGVLIINMKVPVGVAIIVAIMLGALIGAWQGFWIAYMRIPAFIVTLAGMLLFRGLTIKILQGQTLAPFPQHYLYISSGYIRNVMGSAGKLDIFTMVVAVVLIVAYASFELRRHSSKLKKGFERAPIQYLIIRIVLVSLAILGLFYSLAMHNGIPFVLLIISVLIIIYSFFTSKTIPGRHVYAMGGNEKAAKLSGINTNRVLFFVYMNMGILAAVAGAAFTARLQAAQPTAGMNFELDAIAACYIGGASAYGGVGTVLGAVIGALVMGVLNNGMSILGFGSDMQMAIKGLVLLGAVAFDVISNKGKL